MHRDRSLANDFADAIEQALDLIGRHPLAGVALDGHFRRAFVRRFPFSVVYRLHGDDIIVIAIAHTSREPGYWRTRR